MSRTALRVTAGPAVGKLIVVDEDLTIGSAHDGHAALGDPSLSASHALLTRDHMDEWMVRDLGSSSGTFLNGELLTSIEPLHRGDSLRLGHTRLVVVEGSHRPPQSSRALRSTAPAPSALGVPSAPAPWFATGAPPEPPIMERPAPEPVDYRRLQLEDRIAPFVSRALAAGIDGVIATAIIAASWVALGFSLVSSLLGIAAVLCWDFLFESLRGQTIGKRIMKVKVVRRDGSKLLPQHVAARSVLRLIDGLPGPAPLVGLLSITASGARRRQRLGDLAAGTVVVKSERQMSRLPEALRDRLILIGYPLLWLAPVGLLALSSPAVTVKPCRDSVLVSESAPEQTCLAAAFPGRTAAMTFVNAGHTLHWQGYDIRLLATRARSVRRLHGAATLVALKFEVTNTSPLPMRFSHRAVQMTLKVPLDGQVRDAHDLTSRLHFHEFPALTSSRPIRPGATRTGWARFAVPSSVVPTLNTTLSAVTFWEPKLPPGLLHVGYMRLWHAANAQGAAAIRVRSE